MASTDQAHAPLQNVSIQAKHAENLPNLHSILISIGNFCDNECIVTFNKHRVKVIRKRRTRLKAIVTQ